MKKDKKTNLTPEIPETDEKESSNVEVVPNDPEVSEEAVTSGGDRQETPKKLSSNTAEAKYKRWLPYVITFVALATITVLIGLWKKGFVDNTVRYLLGTWCDAFFVSGVLGLGFGLLVLASNGGAFDMFAYGARKFFRLFRKDPIDRKYRTFYDYRQARKEKKRSFWYMVIVGGAFLAVAIVLFLIRYYKFPATDALITE